MGLMLKLFFISLGTLLLQFASHLSSSLSPIPGCPSSLPPPRDRSVHFLESKGVVNCSLPFQRSNDVSTVGKLGAPQGFRAKPCGSERHLAEAHVQSEVLHRIPLDSCVLTCKLYHLL